MDDMRADEISRDLSARAAGPARRLADFVAGNGSEDAGATATAAFLRRWARTAQDAAPKTPPQRNPIRELVSRLGLTEVERDLLLLAGLPDEHEAMAVTFRQLHTRGWPHPAVGLAAHVAGADGLDRDALRRLLHEGAAVRTGVLKVVGDGPFYERAIVVADQLWDALHGYAAWPDAVGRLDAGPPPAGLDGWLDLPGVRQAVAALRSSRRRTLLVAADDETVALSRCAALAAVAGVRLVAGRVRPDDADAVGLLAVHAAARGGVPVLVVAAPPGGERPPALDLRRVTGPALVCGENRALRPDADRPILVVPLGPIGVADRRAAWRAALPGFSAEAPRLAARHPLDPALTAQVALDVRSRQDLRDGGPEPADVSDAIRARAGAVLPAGVELVGPAAGWSRLVMAREAAGRLGDAVARLEHQSLVLDDWGMREAARADRGVRLLFTGPPGTGKSLAAEVVATAAGTDLLVVDVSRVVSKWLGETEKNLAAVFDVAERTQAVLFLDEADVLFGARTEIGDAHDRYANLETAYLLQRLDRFDGLAVLATNLHQNIDPAFLRRMDFVVEFALPEQPERHHLWALHLPGELRGEDVDLEFLAQVFPVPGAWIRNAAIAAAFLAAADDGLVRQEHLLTSMRREYAKASRPAPDVPGIRPAGDLDERAARQLAAHAASRSMEDTA
jgi:hypothetical protein